MQISSKIISLLVTTKFQYDTVTLQSAWQWPSGVLRPSDLQVLLTLAVDARINDNLKSIVCDL